MGDSAITSQRPGSITGEELNPRDVLLGRGIGPSTFSGNVTFRDFIVAARKQEYISESSYKRKRKIAKEVYLEVKCRGGRFLRLVDSPEKPSKDVVENGFWEEICEKEALEKVKQSLREMKKDKTSGETKDGDDSYQDANEQESTLADGDSPLKLTATTVPVGTSLTWPAEAPFGAPSSIPSLVDSRLLLFQQILLNSQGGLRLQPPLSNSNFGSSVYPPVPLNEKTFPRANDAISELSAHVGLYNHQLESLIAQSQTNDLLQSRAPSLRSDDQTSATGTTLSMSFGSESSDSDIEDAAFVLSCLAVSDRPKFTKEDEMKERALLTNEERAAALADILGKKSSILSFQTKRAKRDFDRDSIYFLVGCMRYELDKIPVDRKQALVDAQKKADTKEFSNIRLEQFLRVEGMSPKLGAMRFVEYWKARRSVFGSEKYVLPMTLTGALCEDMATLQVGMYCLLPHLDSSGRQVFFIEPHRHTKRGYSTESLLRCIWYTAEVAAEKCTHIDRGCVSIGWDAQSSIFDFEPKLFNALAHFEKNCWPLKFLARHLCCTSSMVLRVMNPVLMFLLDKESRSRLVIHNVPESDILDFLAPYGLTKDVLPTEMGGNIVYNQCGWIANRRAREIEEL